MNQPAIPPEMLISACAAEALMTVAIAVEAIIFDLVIIISFFKL